MRSLSPLLEHTFSRARNIRPVPANIVAPVRKNGTKPDGNRPTRKKFKSKNKFKAKRAYVKS